jgi:1,4-dihydroxy-2-naphthoate octaprenyltransferase
LIYLRGGLTLILLGMGAFFVLFYTFPLKYIALGEIAVLVVWGPLMVGGGYYEITGIWDWNVVIASLPYACRA